MLLKLANLAGGEGVILTDYATSDPTSTHRVGERANALVATIIGLLLEYI